MKKLLMLVMSMAALLAVAGCNDADVVSRNIGQEADKFNVLRRVIFVNGITGEYLLSIEGYCSLGNDRSQWELNVTCKTGGAEYKKHFLGLSDNVTYFVEQMESANVSPDHYKVVFKPSVIIPDVEIR